MTTELADDVAMKIVEYLTLTGAKLTSPNMHGASDADLLAGLSEHIALAALTPGAGYAAGIEDAAKRLEHSASMFIDQNCMAVQVLKAEAVCVRRLKLSLPQPAPAEDALLDRIADQTMLERYGMTNRDSPDWVWARRTAAIALRQALTGTKGDGG